MIRPRIPAQNSPKLVLVRNKQGGKMYFFVFTLLKTLPSFSSSPGARTGSPWKCPHSLLAPPSFCLPPGIPFNLVLRRDGPQLPALDTRYLGQVGESGAGGERGRGGGMVKRQNSKFKQSWQYRRCGWTKPTSYWSCKDHLRFHIFKYTDCTFPLAKKYSLGAQENIPWHICAQGNF